MSDRLAKIKKMFRETWGVFDPSVYTSESLGIRNNFVWLIAEVERLRAENERLRAELQAIVYTPLDPHHQDDPTAFYRASAQDAVKKAARALKGERR